MKLTYIIFLSIVFISCNNQNKERVTTLNKKYSSEDITSYEGNALIFFKKDCRSKFDEYVYLILVNKRDSDVFKSKDFDVDSYIKDKSSIFLYWGYKWWNDLNKSKEKKTLSFKTCNVEADYYIKVWISYSRFIETRQKRKPLTTDNCAIRTIYYKSKYSKDIEYRILK